MTQSLQGCWLLESGRGSCRKVHKTVALPPAAVNFDLDGDWNPWWIEAVPVSWMAGSGFVNVEILLHPQSFKTELQELNISSESMV